MALMDLSLAGLGIPIWAMVVMLAWSLIWKGLAMWKSARLNQPIWFVAILVINTFGILEILYIYVFSKFGFDHLRARHR
jgi:hypothetical protein